MMEGFPSLGTQSSRGPTGDGAGVGQGNQTTNTGLTPSEYRGNYAEAEEDKKPGSLENNQLKAVIDELKTYMNSGMDANQVKNMISKLSDVERKVD